MIPAVFLRTAVWITIPGRKKRKKASYHGGGLPLLSSQKATIRNQAEPNLILKLCWTMSRLSYCINTSVSRQESGLVMTRAFALIQEIEANLLFQGGVIGQAQRSECRADHDYCSRAGHHAALTCKLEILIMKRIARSIEVIYLTRDFGLTLHFHIHLPIIWHLCSPCPPTSWPPPSSELAHPEPP